MSGDFIINHNHTDVHGHGTHVAGTAGGKRYGVARKSVLIACKVLTDEGWGMASDSILAMEFISNRMKEQRSQNKTVRAVINMSLGSWAPSFARETAVQAVHEEGALSVASAGNSANDSCLFSPARMASILTVAATDMDDQFTSWTNYGPCTDIAAPGLNIMGPNASSTDQYFTASGTSMSAPHVAGVVARYLSVLSDREAASISANVVKARIVDMASRHQVDQDRLELKATPDRLLYKVDIVLLPS